MVRVSCRSARGGCYNASEPVGLYSAMRHPAAAQLTQMLDPVCRMAIAKGREARRITLAQTEYVFCSGDCADRFAANPNAYTLRHPEL